MIKHAIITLSFIALFINCSDSEVNYTIESLDGVEYITNHFPKYRDNTRISLEHVRTIGTLDQGDSNYQLFHPTDIALTKDGSLFVVDAGNFRVQKYDKNGKYVGTFGVKGQGPGELMKPDGIALDMDENIYIADGENVRITKYSPDGELLKTLKLPVISPLRITTDNEIITMRVHAEAFFRVGFPQKGDKQFAVYDFDGNLKNEFHDCEVYDHPLKTAAGNRSRFELDSKGNIIRSFELRNRIEVYSQKGKLNRVFAPVFDYDPGETSMLNIGLAVDHHDRVWTISVVEDFDPVKMIEDHSHEEYAKRTDLYALDVFTDKGVWLRRIPVERTGFRIRIFGEILFIIDYYTNMTVDEFRIIG